MNIFYSQITDEVNKIPIGTECGFCFKKRSTGKISEASGRVIKIDNTRELITVQSPKGIKSVPYEGIRKLWVGKRKMKVLV